MILNTPKVITVPEKKPVLPSQQQIDKFIDMIDYNRSQRNNEKDFLMEQFELGNIGIKESETEGNMIIAIDSVDRDPGMKSAMLLFKFVNKKS